MLSLGAISVAAWWTEARVLTLPPSWSVMPRRAASYLASGVVVGLLEEIICRGVLFRLFKRLWRFWPAAIFSSALFAIAHFLSPHPDAFIAGNTWTAVLQVYLDTFAGAWRNTAFLMRLTNLTLLGMVLCAFLERRGSIWLSVGAHAGWVWIIKFHAFLTIANPARPSGIWFGERADFTDGLLAAGLMIALLIWSLTNRHTTKVRQGKLTWHVDHERADDWRQWLRQHAWEHPGNGPEAPGRTLKAYDGCRVSALDGLVIKARWPRAGWGGRRFAWRPSRARRNFHLGLRLRTVGLSTPAPLAWCSLRRHGLRCLEYLVTDELQGARPLTQRLARATAGERTLILEAYGALMARFHLLGYANRDFKHENVMAGDAPDRLWVVDLDGVRRRFHVTRRRAGRDLGRVGGCLAYVPGNSPDDTTAFFAGYNALAPLRLRRTDFPPPP
ncbi:MAG: type II CAAX prenyl endopeptidase Rce1 family protein [Kiritimatiellia bacterium]